MPCDAGDFSLGDKFSILDTIKIGAYDHDLRALQQRLMRSKKPCYSAREKIVILHIDTDYYYQNHALGFVIHNLFVIWRELDIPYSAMVLIHNHDGIANGLEYFLVDQHDSPTLIHTVANHESLIHIRGGAPQSDTGIQHHALCLLGHQRGHRVKLMQYLKHNDLLHRVRTNFGMRPIDKKQRIYTDSGTDNPAAIPLHTVYSNPHRVNEDIFNSSRQEEIIQLSSITVEPYQDPVLTGEISDFYHRFAVDIVTETLFHVPHVYITDKTLRPLLLRSPFVVFGPPGLLKMLHRYGFCTFDDFWDESYDDITDPHLRFLACCRIVKQLADLELDRLLDMRESMSALLDHNRKVLLDYIDDQLMPLYKRIGLHDKCKKPHG